MAYKLPTLGLVIGVFGATADSNLIEYPVVIIRRSIGKWHEANRGDLMDIRIRFISHSFQTHLFHFPVAYLQRQSRTSKKRASRSKKENQEVLPKSPFLIRDSFHASSTPGFALASNKILSEFNPPSIHPIPLNNNRFTISECLDVLVAPDACPHVARSSREAAS